MRAYKVAWLLFKNNIKLYKFYMIVLTFTVAIYYNFLAITYNPYVSALTTRVEAARTGGWMCSFVLFFVLIFFMLHATNFFYKQRYKEIATYMLMGIKKRQIAKVIAFESSIVGGITLLAGSLLGIVFSKLFFMVLGSSSILDTHIPFYFSIDAVIVLVLLIGSILAVLALRNSYLVRHSKLINLLNASKREERMPRQRIVRGLLGFASISCGYYLAIKLKEYDADGMSSWLIILLLVCVGTYLLFSGFFSLVLSGCIANKNISYKGNRLISFSNTLFRLGTNYRSYAATTILCAAALTALMTSLALKQFDRDRIKLEAPYSISYINEDASINKKIEDKINESSMHKMTGKSAVHFILTTDEKGSGENKITEETMIAPYSEIKANLEMLQYPGRDKIFETMEPTSEKVSKIKHATVAFSMEKLQGETYKVGEKIYTLKTIEKIPFMGAMPDLGGLDTLVVTDEEYTRLKADLGVSEKCLNNINFTDQKESLELVSSIIRLIPNYEENLNCYVEKYQSRYCVFGAFYFLGFILSLLFMITVLSTIYFKCMSDVYSDQKQYSILDKIGISKIKIRKSIDTQLAIAIMIPVLIGMMHSWVAMGILEKYMHMDFLESKLKAIGILGASMLIGFILISRRYMQMVTKRE